MIVSIMLGARSCSLEEFLHNTQTGKTFACASSYDRQKYVRHAESSASSAKHNRLSPSTLKYMNQDNSHKASFTEVNICSK